MHTPDQKDAYVLSLPAPADTDALGARLAAAIVPGLVIWLEGDLGAGKTALTRAVLRALGHTGPVKSPTYTLVELYKFSSLYCYHFDFYRFNEPEEFFDAGLGEYFRADTVCFVEWPEKAFGCVPDADLRVTLRHVGEAREARIEAGSERGHACLTRIRNPASPALNPVPCPSTPRAAG